jgi:hypothetical protein
MEIGRDRETDRRNARAKRKMVRVKVYGDRDEGNMIGVWLKPGGNGQGCFFFPSRRERSILGENQKKNESSPVIACGGRLQGQTSSINMIAVTEETHRRMLRGSRSQEQAILFPLIPSDESTYIFYIYTADPRDNCHTDYN